MTLEERVVSLEKKYKALSRSVKQMQDNQTPITSKTDNNAMQVERLTPYTETKTGYYGEKEKTFYDVPMGNVTVIFDNYSGDYSVSRMENRLTVTFDTLTEQTNITISIL